MKVRGKLECYEKRIKSKKHLGRLRFVFPGNWEDIKEIIRIFGDTASNRFAPIDRAKYYPVLCYGASFAAADFKFCYEQFEKLIRQRNGVDTWFEIYNFFEKNRVNELYNCIDRNPDLTYLYNLPAYLIFDHRISAGAFRVLCAFIIRSKKMPKMGGIKICGWSSQGLGDELNMHRDSVSKYINELEKRGFLKLLPNLSNMRKKTYRVKL